MKKRTCRECSFYRPHEGLRGCLGLCEKHHKATGIDQRCSGFKKGPQTWLCGAPVVKSSAAPYPKQAARMH